MMDCWSLRDLESNQSKTVEDMLIRMLEKLMQESQTQQLQVPLNQYEDRLAHYTGIPKSDLRALYDKTVKKRRKKWVSLSEHLDILKGLTKIYLTKEPHNVQTLYKTLEFQPVVAHFKTLEKFEEELNILGINYHSFHGHEVLMEDPKITFERHAFLHKMTKVRDLMIPIYYVSERIIDADYQYKKHYKENVSNSSDEFIFFHAISRSGVTNGMICKDPTDTDFYKWVFDVLLKLLQPQSAVVLDRSVHYGPVERKPMSMYDTREDMLKWLRRHNVPCSNSLAKPQLYELLKRHLVTEDLSPVEQLLLAEGFEVLRLPNNFDDLSPLEDIWQQFSNHCKSLHLGINQVKEILLSRLNYIVREKLFTFGSVFNAKERLFLETDKLRDDSLEAYILSLKKEKIKTVNTNDKPKHEDKVITPDPEPEPEPEQNKNPSPVPSVTSSLASNMDTVSDDEVETIIS